MVKYNDSKKEEATGPHLLGEDRKKKLRAKFSRLEDLRKPMEIVWDKVAEFILPYRVKIDENGASLVLNQKIFNATPISASRMAASFFVGTVTPRSIPWNMVVIRNQQVFRNRAISQWCKGLEAHFNQRYESSNYYESQFSFVKHGLDFGTSARFIEVNEKDKTLNFDVLPVKSYYIDENQYGEIDVLWREIFMAGHQILDRFDIQDEVLRNKITARKDLTRVLHIVQPRSYCDPDSKLNTRFPFESLYVLPDDSWSLLEESGYKMFPYTIWRPYYEPGLVWGIGPGVNCARPAFIAQKSGKSLLDAGEMMSNPAYNVPASKRGKENLFPGGRFYYESHDEVVSPIQMGGSYPYGKDVVDEINQWVKEQYFIPEFLLLSQNDNKDRTALEVDALQAERTPIVDTITASFTSGPLDHEMERIFQMDSELGLIPPMPNIGQGAIQVVIDYIGPLAQQQRKFHKQIGIRQLVAELIPIAQAGRPDVLDPIDFDAYDRELADANGANHILFDQEYVDQVRAARAQQQQDMLNRQMQQQEAIAAAEVSSKGGKAPEQGSLSERLINQ